MKKLYKRRGLLSLFMLVFMTLLSSQIATAQTNQTATGTVVDVNGNPIIGVSVIYGNSGDVTNAEGAFQLRNVPVGATLSFQFMGMTTVERKFEGTALRVVMEDSALAMDEVIVVAFGEQTRSSFTGSVGVVNAEQMAMRPVNNIMNAIDGQVTGLQSLGGDGSPTESTPSFRIRGIGSIGASSSPLIVVDGAPFSGSMSDINPNDVESISVLKDAASHAIYGARGGNGVILVTTKRAKSGEATVTFDARIGLNKMNKKDTYEYITDPGEYYEAYYMAHYNKFTREDNLSAYDAHIKANETIIGPREAGGLVYNVFTVPDNEYLVGSNGKLNPKATLGRKVTHPDTGEDYWLQPDDWWNEGYRTGVRQDYNVSVSGGDSKLNYYSSIGYTKNEGIIEGSDYERVTARLRSSYQAKKWLRVGANFNITKSDQNDASSITSMINTIAPIYPLYIRDGEGNIMQDENGNMYDYGNGVNAGLSRPYSSGSNSIQNNKLNYDYRTAIALNATTSAEITFSSKFKYVGDVTLQTRDYRRNNTSQPFYNPSSEGGKVTVRHGRTIYSNTKHIFRYTESIKGHNINAFVGYEFTRNRGYTLRGQRTDMYNYFNNQELDGAIIAVGSDVNTSNTNEHMIEGYMAQVNYDYEGKYVGSFSFRREGSTNFHPDNRWGNFWSLGGAWIMSREDWFNASWVDMLKIRASYGESGNEDIGIRRYEDRFTLVNSNDEKSFLADRKGNRDVTWETNISTTLGAEFEMFKGRLNGSVEVYKRKTKDVLLGIALPYSSGYGEFYGNAGTIENKGFEVDLSGTLIKTRDFRWQMNLNLSHNKNRIKKLPKERMGTAIDGVNVGWYSGSRLTAVGYSRYEMYVRSFAGIDEEGLALLYTRDRENTGIITGVSTISTDDTTYYPAGSTEADLSGGWGTSFSWKGITLSMLLKYSIGGKAYDSNYASTLQPPYGSTVGRSIHKNYLKSWTPENPTNDYARWHYASSSPVFNGTNTRWVTDASYLDFKNIQLAYDIPSKLVNKYGLKSLRLTASCENIAFVSARRGFHPNAAWNGDTDATVYPRPRTFTFGLNLQF